VKLTRRKAIVGGVLGAGFVGVGWWFAHERERLGDRTLLHVKSGEAGLNGWVTAACCTSNPARRASTVG